MHVTETLRGPLTYPLLDQFEYRAGRRIAYIDVTHIIEISDTQSTSSKVSRAASITFLNPSLLKTMKTDRLIDEHVLVVCVFARCNLKAIYFHEDIKKQLDESHVERFLVKMPDGQLQGLINASCNFNTLNFNEYKPIIEQIISMRECEKRPQIASKKESSLKNAPKNDKKERCILN